MSDEILARLQQIQGHALKIQAAMQSQPSPSEGRGSDPRGCVAVVVDPDGLPSRIEAWAGWQRHVAAEELGSLVLRLFREVAAQTMRAWSESFDQEAWRSRAEAAPLSAFLAAQATSMVNLHGEAVDSRSFPGGKWPSPNSSTYSDASVKDGDADWSLA
ncbi:hypothetical protein AB0K35_09160 [Micromonospora sp. NPDC053740]|uniref:hypothetical protein n=1 Tax=Micromonospora sp. NPDC053740 TaxID=3155173 RepID=UPI0034131463